MIDRQRALGAFYFRELPCVEFTVFIRVGLQGVQIWPLGSVHVTNPVDFLSGCSIEDRALFFNQLL